MSDRKLQVSSGGVTIDYYNADVVTATDYYPFGMAMSGRSYSSDGYRYGFNGKEKDKAMNSLTAYDYGFRIYNPAIGKFLSVDPLTKNYPGWSPYPFAMNSSISGVDLDGLEYYYAADGTFIGKGRTDDMSVRVIKSEDVATAHSLLRRKQGATVKDFNKISADVGIKNDELKVKAMLYSIRRSENHGSTPLPYDRLYGPGEKTFTGEDINGDGTITESEKYADHPRQHIKAWGRTSSGAGAYGIMGFSFDDYKKRTDVPDFSPKSQDILAVAMIKDRKVLEDVKRGSITQEILKKLGNTWTSLPGGKEEGISKLEFDVIFKEGIKLILNGTNIVATPNGELGVNSTSTKPK